MRSIVAILLACAVLASPRAPGAQQPARTPKIGILTLGVTTGTLGAFRQGLKDLGYIEGQTIVLEHRNADGKPERLDGLAAELVRLRPDIVVTGGTQATEAARKAAGAIPIVMALSGDAVGTGLVASLARPGGTITGLTIVSPELSGKRLELLRELVPKLSRIAVLWNPTDPPRVRDFTELQAAAQRLRVTVTSAEMRSADDLDSTFATVTGARPQAMIVFPDPVVSATIRRVVDFAARRRLPTMFGSAAHVEAGGLIAFGPSFVETYRRAAYFVDRILKGAKPADLPIEQPTRFELFINARTAKAIGVTIPRSLLLRADRVIE